MWCSAKFAFKHVKKQLADIRGLKQNTTDLKNGDITQSIDLKFKENNPFALNDQSIKLLMLLILIDLVLTITYLRLSNCEPSKASDCID